MTHLCINNLTIIGSDNGLSPGRHQAIIWTSDGQLLIEHLGTNFSEILIEILTFFIQESAFESVVWKMAAILSWPQWVNRPRSLMHASLIHMYVTREEWFWSGWQFGSFVRIFVPKRWSINVWLNNQPLHCIDSILVILDPLRPKTKWMTFGRWYFPMHFLNKKCILV